LILALFESIENNQVECLKSLLDKDGKLHINALNNDGLSPLDIAVLLENHVIIKILLQHGAYVGIDSNEDIENHLNALLMSSEQKLYQITNTSATTSSGQSSTDNDKDKLLYDKRIKILRKMIIGWKNLRIPDTPFSFSIGL
jgi:ankyrin repeat protein